MVSMPSGEHPSALKPSRGHLIGDGHEQTGHAVARLSAPDVDAPGVAALEVLVAPQLIGADAQSVESAVRVVRLIGVLTDRLQREHIVAVGARSPDVPARRGSGGIFAVAVVGRDGSGPISKQLRHSRDAAAIRTRAAMATPRIANQRRRRHHGAAGTPPIEVGIGDRPLGGVLPGDRPSGGVMLGERPVDRLRDRCRSRARPFDRLSDRDALTDQGGARRGGIDDGSRLSALGGLQFGEPSLSRRIPRDVGIRSVRAPPQALQLSLLRARPTPAGHPCPDYPPGHQAGKGVPRREAVLLRASRLVPQLPPFARNGSTEQTWSSSTERVTRGCPTR